MILKLTCGIYSTEIEAPKIFLNGPDQEYQIILFPYSVFKMNNFKSKNSDCPIEKIEVEALQQNNETFSSETPKLLSSTDDDNI